MAENFDAIVIGGGHNGLVAAFYLKKSGLNVCLIEDKNELGGLCKTYEFLPGFKGTNPHSPGSFEPMIIQDMRLEKFGLKMQTSDPSLIMPFEEDRAFFGWRNKNDLKNEYKKFSLKDGAATEEFYAFLNNFAKKLNVSSFEPPKNIHELTRNLKSDDDFDNFRKLIFGTTRDLMEEWFESSEIQALHGFLCQLNGNGGPSTPGSNMSFLNRPISMNSQPQKENIVINDPRKQPLRGSTGLPMGGMGAIIDAMELSLRELGVKIIKGNGAKEILVKKNKITGVVLIDGQKLSSKIIVSAINPKTTFLKLMDEAHFDEIFYEKVSNIKLKVGSFKAFIVVDAVPKFSCAPKGLEELVSGCQIRIGPTLDYLDNAWSKHIMGEMPDKPVIWGLIPTLRDPSLAPKGYHFLSLNVWNVPYRLRRGDWEAGKDIFGQRCIDTMARYIPNLKDIMVDKVFLSPLDMEKQYNLLEGDPHCGAMGPEQMFGNRLLPSISKYKTQFTGLYLSGAGTWPGGFISGLSGHNAAKKVINDLTYGIQ